MVTEVNPRRISAGGGTDHLAALSAALRMNPDVVFFYTDADDPVLSEEDLGRVQRLNRSALIHVIEFGEEDQGEKEAGDSFLTRLAKQNGGEYRYLDLKRWAAESKLRD